MNVVRRSFLQSFAGGAAGYGLMSMVPGSSVFASRNSMKSEQRKWNILYLTADDLGTDLGCYGHPVVKSPRIDAFATESLLFEHCYAQVAVCTASRACILTGTRQPTNQVLGIDDDWRDAIPDAMTLPRLLRENGYATAAWGKIFDHRGGSNDEPWGPPVGKDPDPNIDYGKSHWGKTGSGEPKRRLQSLANTTDPWFLGIGFENPHCPWNGSSEARNQYPEGSVEPEGDGRTFSEGYMQHCLSQDDMVMTDEEAAELTRRYYAEVTDFDRWVGDVLDELKNLGLWDSTIVIVWSGDHGLHIGTNGRWEKWTCYNAVTHVPLLMRVPGVTDDGERMKGMMETVDLYPTLIDLCGLSLPPQALEGYSFAEILDAPPDQWKSAVFSDWGKRDEQSIKTERYRLITNPDGDELYDHSVDWAENNNIAADNPDIVAALKQRLDDGWEAAIPGATKTRGGVVGRRFDAGTDICRIRSILGRKVVLDIGTIPNGTRVEIRDVRGRLVLNRRVTQNAEIVFNVPGPGNYVVRIIGIHGNITRRFVAP